jgi:hypothetical protein
MFAPPVLRASGPRHAASDRNCSPSKPERPQLDEPYIVAVRILAGKVVGSWPPTNAATTTAPGAGTGAGAATASLVRCVLPSPSPCSMCFGTGTATGAAAASSADPGTATESGHGLRSRTRKLRSTWFSAPPACRRVRRWSRLRSGSPPCGGVKHSSCSGDLSATSGRLDGLLGGCDALLRGAPPADSPFRACGSRAPLKKIRPTFARRATGGCPAPVPRVPGVRLGRCSNSRAQRGT